MVSPRDCEQLRERLSLSPLILHWLRVPPPKIVPLSASERQSGVILGTAGAAFNRPNIQTRLMEFFRNDAQVKPPFIKDSFGLCTGVHSYPSIEPGQFRSRRSSG